MENSRFNGSTKQRGSDDAAAVVIGAAIIDHGGKGDKIGDSAVNAAAHGLVVQRACCSNQSQAPGNTRSQCNVLDRSHAATR